MIFKYLEQLEVTDQFDQSIIFLNKTFSIFRNPESEKYFKLCIIKLATVDSMNDW